MSCPDIMYAYAPQIALDGDRLWGSLGDDHDVFFTIEQTGSSAHFDWLSDLPGTNFSGQAPDGRLYRYLNWYEGYIYNDGEEWYKVPVELPDDLSGYFAFQVRPDGLGQLHAQFHTGQGAGPVQYASLTDGEWSWEQVGVWGGSGPYAGTDAWDRPFYMRFYLSGGQARWLLSLDGESNVPVGTPDADPGFLARPPRPALGGDTPIAVLHRIPGEPLNLLSIVDSDNWSENPIAGTPELPELCDEVFSTTEAACPPCHVQAKGIEFDAYQIVQTSGGQLWGVWVVSNVDFEYVYDIEQLNDTKWKCTADLEQSSPYAETTLVVAELGSEGEIGKTLELPLETVWVDDFARRHVVASAYGDDIAVMIQTDPEDTAAAVRVLRIDTDEI
ncbi:hypothetical protein G6O69_31320 [Pseudenhygromyxa sp. WMMC2535]|uniref:hypothetical protein n=1 Tax=Pseudenhygromyxa sp. WMMC2535 TaxID=2712867 RepID=UPI001555288A|nr:hypothetical protein [Pseudenhygromyxa sp. WMMC2535]NVB42355.1 hypothetical protein [Pseudenhygromyxa sp. WMMC2535]